MVIDKEGSMYNFIDVTEIQNGSNLPSEALQLNGEYIENQITGYRTLYVSGREAMSPELATKLCCLSATAFLKRTYCFLQVQ